MKPILLNQFLEIAKKSSSLNQEIAQKITYSLGLTFLNNNEFSGNICFANNPEVRTEFRENFTSIDLQNYIYATFHSTEYTEASSELSKVDFQNNLVPTDKDQFWKLVQIGRELHQIHLSKNL